MIRLLAATLIALVVCALAVPAQANSITDSGTLMTTSTITATGNPSVFDLNSTGSGIDSLSGSFTTKTTSTVTFTSPGTSTQSGSFVDVFSQGTTFGTFTGTGTPTGVTDKTAITDNAIITGGTGIFAGATGEFTLTGTSTQTSSTTSSFTGSYTGFITVPEPDSLALLFSGIGTLLMMRKRIALDLRI